MSFVSRAGRRTLPNVSKVIRGLQKVYRNQVLPMEKRYLYHEFFSAPLTDVELEAKPMAMLLGQYSTGKTTFVEHVLGQKFAGQRVGPEPTTDRFSAIMQGETDRIVPGNAVSVDASKPFQALTKQGLAFLNKFEAVECTAPLLQHMTFVDTPGVLSGEKQRLGRSYDMSEVVRWFADRSDLIFLLFDAHKLDISDEFKETIESLQGHDDKIRVVLNKADQVNPQQLMRVYGALMWSLGKIVATPEVIRVYLGSFWDQPLRQNELTSLFQAEEHDLLTDLHDMPRNSTIRKVNEIVKRARLVKTHALLLSHFKSEMPMLFGKSKKQAELLFDLPNEFSKVAQKHQLAVGDFPPLDHFRRVLETMDFSKLPSLDKRMVSAMDAALEQDIPALMDELAASPEECESSSVLRDLCSQVHASDENGRSKI